MLTFSVLMYFRAMPNNNFSYLLGQTIKHILSFLLQHHIQYPTKVHPVIYQLAEKKLKTPNRRVKRMEKRAFNANVCGLTSCSRSRKKGRNAWTQRVQSV